MDARRRIRTTVLFPENEVGAQPSIANEVMYEQLDSVFKLVAVTVATSLAILLILLLAIYILVPR